MPPAQSPTATGASRDVRGRASPAGGGQVAVAAVAGDACTNSQYDFWQIGVGRAASTATTSTAAASTTTTRRSRRSSTGIATGTRRTTAAASTTSRTSRRSTSARRARRSTRTPTARRSPTRAACASICPGALACTWLFTDASGHTTETDQRYNENFTFSNVGAAGAYDYESISAHETGHSIGLDHANSSNALTMYYQIAGRHDARPLARQGRRAGPARALPVGGAGPARHGGRRQPDCRRPAILRPRSISSPRGERRSVPPDTRPKRGRCAQTWRGS